MAKQSGLGDALYVSGYDLSGDIGSLSRIGGGPAALDVTGIDKGAFERIGGERDGSIEFSAWFNPSTNQAHPRLSALPTADVLLTYCRGTTLGSPAASLVAKQINYDGNRGDDASFTFSVQAQGSGYGLEWGVLLTAGKRTDTAATNGTGVDFGADAPGFFDAQAYLHVFAFAGTDATVKVQTSQDNGAVDPWSDRITFTAITAGPTSERKTQTLPGSQTMERYARVITTTSAGFTNLVFAVMLNRNDTAVVF